MMYSNVCFHCNWLDHILWDIFCKTSLCKYPAPWPKTQLAEPMYHSSLLLLALMELSPLLQLPNYPSNWTTTIFPFGKHNLMPYYMVMTSWDFLMGLRHVHLRKLLPNLEQLFQIQIFLFGLGKTNCSFTQSLHFFQKVLCLWLLLLLLLVMLG